MNRLSWIAAATMFCLLAPACGSDDDAGAKSGSKSSTTKTAGKAKGTGKAKAPAKAPRKAKAPGKGKGKAAKKKKAMPPPVKKHRYGKRTRTLAQADVSKVWPITKTSIFQTTFLVVGLPNSDVDGQIAVIRNSAPLPKGQKVPAGAEVHLLPKGVAFGQITLPIGKNEVIVQVLDDSGASLGEEWSTPRTYFVGKDPAVSRVWFIEPQDGATVSSKFHVKFGVEGMTLSPGGKNFHSKRMGHHHLLVNLPPFAPGMGIPRTEKFVHFDNGETEGDVELAPGKYKLTLQFADSAHRSYGHPMAATINITVE